MAVRTQKTMSSTRSIGGSRAGTALVDALDANQAVDLEMVVGSLCLAPGFFG